MTSQASLVLSDGTVFKGWSLGASAETSGEICFNTGMTGYQEILSDPSYAGQLVVLTYPLIGNYGVNEDDFESDRIQPKGLIISTPCHHPSNWRSTKTLDQTLLERGVTGICGIDTRELTQKIRSEGALMACITQDAPEAALERLGATLNYVDEDLVQAVTTLAPYAWGYSGREKIEADAEGYKHRIVVIDCGLKFNILRRFAALGVRSVVLPMTATSDEILAWNPDGIVLSPGPGDPARLENVVDNVCRLIGTRPIFGICLGNQILAQAIGARTFKMKFGHRGSNHPVKDLLDGSVTITSQNHGFAVDPDSVPSIGEITQMNLNDGTVEGIRVKGEDACSIQYHPEAAPGPWDSRKYFVQFVQSLGMHSA